MNITVKKHNSLGFNKPEKETNVVVAMSGGVDSSTVAGMILSVLEIDASVSSRLSGTFTIPKFGSIVQNGKLDAWY